MLQGRGSVLGSHWRGFCTMPAWRSCSPTSASSWRRAWAALRESSPRRSTGSPSSQAQVKVPKHCMPSSLVQSRKGLSSGGAMHACMHAHERACGGQRPGDQQAHLPARRRCIPSTSCAESSIHSVTQDIMVMKGSESM